MTKIILGSVLALAASSIAGCTSSGSIDHITTYNWQFSDIAFISQTATKETATGCPGGEFDTAAVISQESSSTGKPIGSCDPATLTNGTCVVDLYDCAAMTGTETLPEAYYLQWVAITNHAGTHVYAQSPSVVIDEITNNTVSADILNNGGYFQFDWLLKNKAGASITCADLANDGISLESTTVATPKSGLSDVFDCKDGTGITSGLPAGTYAISSSILNSSQQAIGTTDLVQDQTIHTHNEITDLGAITIQLN